MVINFNLTLPQALQRIVYDGEFHEFEIHSKNNIPEDYDQFIQQYADAKWNAVGILNKQYKDKLDKEYNLYNWLNHIPDDVAYFLNEAGSNCNNYSDFKAPFRFCLWLGKNGFLLAVEQKGKGFDASEIFLKEETENLENSGGGFRFFKETSSSVFFDNSKEANVVYLLAKF